jgi:hypothetical protein
LTAAAPRLDAGAASRSNDVQIFSGCHSLRNNASEAIEISEAITSTSQGPWKLDTRNCGIAKLTPATRMAGQICKVPRHPANATISQNGCGSRKFDPVGFAR